MTHAARGRHVLVDAYGCRGAALNRPDELATLLVGGCVHVGATVRQLVVERFEPTGCSVVAVLAESHASIHTYPDEGTVFVDVFTCGDLDAAGAVSPLRDALQPVAWESRVVERGSPLAAVPRLAVDVPRGTLGSAAGRLLGLDALGPLDPSNGMPTSEPEAPDDDRPGERCVGRPRPATAPAASGGVWLEDVLDAVVVGERWLRCDRCERLSGPTRRAAGDECPDVGCGGRLHVAFELNTKD